MFVAASRQAIAAVGEDLEAAFCEQDRGLEAHFVCERVATQSQIAALFEKDSLCAEISK